MSRCGSKLIAMVDVLSGFDIHSIDVSQAPLQSDNLAESDRFIAIPPSMIPMPWEEKVHDPETNLETLPYPTHGFPS